MQKVPRRRVNKIRSWEPPDIEPECKILLRCLPCHVPTLAGADGPWSILLWPSKSPGGRGF